MIANLYCGVAMGAELAPEANSQVLETLLKQQAAAFDAIKSVEMEYTYRRDAIVDPIYALDGKVAIAGGREIRSGVIKFWMQGENKREHHQFQREYPDRGALVRDSWEIISTPRYFLDYEESVNQVLLHHLDPQRGPEPAIAARRDSVPWIDLFDYGFLPGKRQLLQSYRDRERWKDRYQYEWILSGGGDELYRIEVLVKEGKTSRKKRELVLNQHCGSLVTSSKNYNKQEELDWDITVEPRQVTPEIWVPGEVRAWSLDNAWTTEISLKHTKLNETIPEKQFTLESMAFDPDRTVLMEYFPNQKGVAKPLYGGVWIPRKQWPEELRQRMVSRPRHLPERGGFGSNWVKGSATD